MKSLLKNIVASILGWQVRRLRAKNSFEVVGVVGSYGKTSTKMAIAEMLETEFHVQYQKGNYNDIVSVPLVFFGLSLPSLFNPFAWLTVFIKNERLLRQEVYAYDIVVLELGIDGPGQMKKFDKYLKLDWALVSALGPEHMEQFASVEDVAKEELAVQAFSDQIIVNKDLCPDELLKSLKKPYEQYTLGYAKKLPLDNWNIAIGNEINIRVEEKILSKARMYSLSAAIVIGKKFDLDDAKIKKKLPDITFVPGRMNALQGKKDSVVIDDSYNASPEAVLLSLQSLYSYPAKQRIALLGNMNELGEFSERMHRQIGDACEPGRLDLVVTLGPDANKYLADSAENKGCNVVRVDNPYKAAEVIEENIKDDCVILVKGSQNGVFAEEAVKSLLKNQRDASKLVRQSETWLATKKKAFGESWLE